MQRSQWHPEPQRRHSLWAVLGIGLLIFTLMLVAIPACIVGGLMGAAAYDPPGAAPKIYIENRIIVGPTPTVVARP